MKPEWTINRRQKECTTCSEPFKPGDEYYAAVTRQEGEFDRQDYCSLCWEKVSEKEDIFSYWRGFLPKKTDDDSEPLSSIEKVEQLLRKLVQRDTIPLKACYILAVILERKRILKQVAVNENPENGERILVFEFCKTGESITLQDPHIKLDEISQVQAEIEEIVFQEFHIE